MAYPTLEQYNQSLQNPQSAFTDPELQKGSVKTGFLGLPLASCGGLALTYEITCSGKKYAVRCFHREPKDLERRYVAISKKIKELNSDYFVNEFEFIADGFKLQNKPVAPIVKMAWAEGEIMGQFVEDNYDNPTALANLRKSLENLADFLEKHHIAHGNIQPGNLMVSNDGKKVQLIDYDGMFIEELKDAGSSEMGHKNFQHPQRNNQWNYTLDRFSFILIDLSLSILEKYPDLWDKTSSDTDVFLFKASDIYNPDGSQLFKDLKNLADCKDKVEKFSNICKEDFEKIPSLKEFLYGKPKPKKIKTINIDSSYTAEISRRNPTAFLFLIDQSGSMSDIMETTGISKAQFVADVLNRTLANLIIRCTKTSGVQNYYDIAVLAYGGNGVVNGFQGELANEFLQPIANLEASPLRVEDRIKKEPDGAGGLVEINTKFPIWFEAKASGGSPMREAIFRAAEILAPWCDAHLDSYPPTIVHITNGESTDGNPEKLAKSLALLHTNDGNVLVCNLHIGEFNKKPIKFPDREDGLPNEYAKMLFRMSSKIPSTRINIIKDVKADFQVSEKTRFYIFNADVVQIIEFFDIGTRASDKGIKE